MYITADAQKDMEAYAARLLKKTTGRGPKAVQLETLTDGVKFRFQGFLSPLEETLLVASQQQWLVRQIRESLVNSWRFG